MSRQFSSAISLFKFMSTWQALAFNHHVYDGHPSGANPIWWQEWLDFNGHINDWGTLDHKIEQLGWAK